MTVNKQNGSNRQQFCKSDVIQIAKQNWLSTDKKPCFNPDLMARIYSSAVALPGLILVLESTGYLENYLWQFREVVLGKGGNLNRPAESDKKTFSFVMSLVCLINHKSERNSDFFDEFTKSSCGNDQIFESMINRVFSYVKMAFSPEKSTILITNPFEKQSLISFLALVFTNAGQKSIKHNVLKRVSISLWDHIKEKRFEDYFAKFPKMKVSWEAHKHRSSGDMAIPLVAKHLAHLAHAFDQTNYKRSDLRLCESILDLFCDMLSQLSTRQFLRFFFLEGQFFTICKMSPFYRWAAQNAQLTSFAALLANFEHFLNYEIDDQTGEPMDQKTVDSEHNIKLAIFQRIAFKYFREDLEDLFLDTVSQIEKPQIFEKHISALSDSKLRILCEKLCLLPLSDSALEERFGTDRAFLLRIIENRYGKKRENEIQKIKQLALYPTESLLWDKNFIPAAFRRVEESPRLVLPKLNLRFLGFQDYLVRNFQLYRLETTFQIREEVGQIISDLKPRVEVHRLTGETSTVFSGSSRMAVPVAKATTTRIGSPLLGETKPSEVLMEIEVDLAPFKSTFREFVFNEWEGLKRHDVLFLCEIDSELAEKANSPQMRSDSLGLRHLRGCEIEAIKDEEYCVIGSKNEKGEVYQPKGTVRTFVVRMDCAQYEKDLADNEEQLYNRFNLIIRRKAKANNFKAVLGTIRNMMIKKPSLPKWLEKTFLGCAASAERNLSVSQNPKSAEIDFGDTFVDRSHVAESFPAYSIEFGADADGSSHLYRLAFDEKRKRILATPSSLRHRRNNLRFTPKQIEAIRSGSQRGLTLVIGPPGTGKTDVAVQIINSLQHNFPKERILMITHSNSALNDLFEKIAKTDLPGKRLLRLGYGYKELETAQNFGRTGRINCIMKKRQKLLGEMGRLFKSIGLGNGTGFTCENSGNFFFYHIIARWESFLKECEAAAKEGGAAPKAFFAEKFPFCAFFAENGNAAGKPLFGCETFGGNLKVARSLFARLSALNEKIAEFSPFETLRTLRDRGDFLFAEYSKVVAMTCTHAALKREDLLALRSEFDSVVVEEAAQILDVEALISLSLQSPETDSPNKLKRLVMIGDHFQLPPVVQNHALKAHSRFDQSLFARLIRLGCPSVLLDQQGRSRSALADLFAWRYNGLGTLPEVARLTSPNPGLAHVFQFIDVPDFLGKGETAPAPHFYQNLGEAEYLVQLYMFLRLLGHPRGDIVLLASYNGQKQLLRDIVRRRCESSASLKRLFGRPAKISTVDKFQGRQSNLVLLSLVRTESLGHLRDIRRLVVALSRARLGLYAFGRRELFEDCPELSNALSRLLAHGDQLAVAPSERFGVAPEAARRLVSVPGVAQLGEMVARMSAAVLGGENSAKRWRDELDEYSKRLAEVSGGKVFKSSE